MSSHLFSFAPEEPVAATPDPGLGARLLIVDDNPAIHDDFRKILRANSIVSGEFEAAAAALFGEEKPAREPAATFQLDSAFQGKEGFDLVQRAIADGQPYATAFVDVRMPPGWDGVETTAKLWEIDPDLQVVICTAYSDYSWDKLLDTLGRTDRLVVLRKPFDEVEVRQLANSLTRKWQLLRESKRTTADLERLVAERTAQVVVEQEKYKAIFDDSPNGIFQTSADGKYLAANPALAAMYGYTSPEQLIEQLTDIQHQLYIDPARRAEFQTLLSRERVVRDFEAEIRCKDGTRKWISETACKVSNPDGAPHHYHGFVVDITARKNAENERSLMEAQLRQAQKLESVGQLAAGIAHEINTPIQYIGDNVRFVQESFASLGPLLRDLQALALASETGEITPQLLASVEALGKHEDIPYYCQEIPLAVKQSLEGVNHVADIVRAMKEFSHPSSAEKSLVDINHAIENTITVARSEWKQVADVVTDLASGLPQIPAHPGELNQVILNLIINAAHAIGDVVKVNRGTRGKITVATRRNKTQIEITIADTGSGIPENIRHRVFDPFFTTKPVGKGTGQGLAIARSTIVDKHSGELTFESVVGQGTTFIIRLPIIPPLAKDAKK